MRTVLQQSVLCTHTQYTPYTFYQPVCYTVLIEVCAAIFPHKTTTTVCLGFCFHTSSLFLAIPYTGHWTLDSTLYSNHENKYTTVYHSSLPSENTVMSIITYTVHVGIIIMIMILVIAIMPPVG